MIHDSDINSMYPASAPLWNILVGGHNFNTNYWPYIKTVHPTDWIEAERFCYQNFKSRNWRSRGQHFAFKREKDYTLFLLRWA